MFTKNAPFALLESQDRHTLPLAMSFDHTDCSQAEQHLFHPSLCALQYPPNTEVTNL